MKEFLNQPLTPRAIIKFVIATAIGALMVACTHPQPVNSRVQRNAADAQNDITAGLVKLQPAPKLLYSDERQNLIERYVRFSDPKHVGYVTITTMNGGILYNGTVMGKVSATSSQLTPADALDCEHYGANDPRPDGCGVVQIAEPDGSWATNGGGLFWFDDKNVYHEINGPAIVMYSDQPQIVTTPAILTINATTQPNAVQLTPEQQAAANAQHLAAGGK